LVLNVILLIMSQRIQREFLFWVVQRGILEETIKVSY